MRPDLAARPPRSRKRRPVQTWPLLAAAAGIALVLVAGCAGGGGPGSSGSATLVIAATPGVDDAPLYLAQQRGYFTAAGLQVVIRNFGSPSKELTAVENGKAQIAASDYGNIFAEDGSLAKGNLRILADGFDPGAGSAEIMLSRQATKITSPQDVQQLSAIGLPSDSLVPGALSAPNSLLAAAASQVLHSYLVAGADTLPWKAMSQAQEVSELGSGTLQAALLTEPYIYQAESRFGSSALLDVFSGPTANLPFSGYVATTSWVKDNAGAAADFQAAMSRAQSEAAMIEPIQHALESLPGSTGMTTAAAKMVSIGTYPTVTTATALGRVLGLLSPHGLLSAQAAAQISLGEMLVNGQ